MTADLLIALARTNVAAGAATLVVLALRGPVRRAFGAHLAYGLWLIAPIAVVGSLLPGPDLPGWAGGLANGAGDAGRAWLTIGWRANDLAALWLAGFAANTALALWRQGRFEAAARAGRAGPAVVGLIQPRLVAPADFALRFSEEERRLIRAHERAHMDRQDCRLGALAVVAGWICWFNPLAPLALSAFRRDQELACDATVMERLPRARRAYAETLLRSQPIPREAVFGCHWLARGHPLETRLDMLARGLPSQSRGDLGVTALALMCAASFGAAWASQPPSMPAHFAPPSVRVDLTSPDAREAAWVDRWWPQRRRD